MRLPSPRGSAVGDSLAFRAAKLLRMGMGHRAAWARSSASGGGCLASHADGDLCRRARRSDARGGGSGGGFAARPEGHGWRRPLGSRWPEWPALTPGVPVPTSTIKNRRPGGSLDGGHAAVSGALQAPHVVPSCGPGLSAGAGASGPCGQR